MRLTEKMGAGFGALGAATAFTAGAVAAPGVAAVAAGVAAGAVLGAGVGKVLSAGGRQLAAWVIAGKVAGKVGEGSISKYVQQGVEKALDEIDRGVPPPEGLNSRVASAIEGAISIRETVKKALPNPKYLSEARRARLDQLNDRIADTVRDTVLPHLTEQLVTPAIRNTLFATGIAVASVGLAILRKAVPS